MMNKKIVFLIGLAFLLVILAAALAGYVYTKDTGVSLSGRPRLDYNWKYLTARSLAHEESYKGKLFSFSYLDYNDKNPLRPFEKDSGGYIFGDLLTVDWFLKPPPEIKSELLGYLSSPAGQIWQPSGSFADWLAIGTDKHYIAGIERVLLKNGVPAAVFSVKAKHDGLAGNYRYLVTEHNGVLVKIENLAGAAVSDEQYRQLVFSNVESYGMEKQVYPDAERDRNSLRRFMRVTKTFEFTR